MRELSSGKKMRIGLLIIIGIILFVIAGWYIAFVYLGWGMAPPFVTVKRVQPDSGGAFTSEEAPLMTLAGSMEEAEKIAGQYNIELVSYEDGIALFRTEEDPYAVIARGGENGYPPLSVNYVRTIDERTEEE